MNLHHYRKQYEKGSLEEAQLPSDPFELFKDWFALAEKVHAHEANSMVLSTAINNKPSARVVLLKEISYGGFVFFTNYNSRKGTELIVNPACQLNFFWPELERQVRIDGFAEKISEDESDTYFNSRPLLSRISAIVSPQSQKIDSRESLEILSDLLQKTPQSVIRPEHWGGFRVFPEMIEFWQGRSNRLHDRICYSRSGDNWSKFRLAP